MGRTVTVVAFAVAGASLLGVAALALSRREPVAAVPSREPEGGPSPTVAPDPEVVGAEDGGFVGVVLARESVDVSSRLDARVDEVRVRLGDTVRRGDVLATLDTRLLAADLRMGEAALKGARADEDKARLELAQAHEKHARRQQSRTQNADSVSGDELSTASYQEQFATPRLAIAHAAVAEKSARVEQLRQTLADAAIRAPFDGTVAARYVDPGATVARGAPLVRLISAGDLWVRFAIPEERGRAVAVGAPVWVRVRSVDALVRGVVEKVSPEVDAASRMILAEARLDLARAGGATTGILAGREARVLPAPPVVGPVEPRASSDAPQPGARSVGVDAPAGGAPAARAPAGGAPAGGAHAGPGSPSGAGAR